MSDQPSTNTELLLLCGKVRDNTLTPDEAKRLDVILQSSDQAKALYVQYMSLVSLLESRGVARMATGEDDAGVSDAVEHDVLAELLQLERAADAELVHDVGRLRVHDDGPWQIGGALRWMASKPAGWGAIAAALAIVLILFAVFSGGNEQPGPIVEQTPVTEEPPLLVVATLVESTDASWQGTDPTLGSDLYAHQSLSLTQGYAKLRLANQAEVILEAPCQIVPVSESAMRIIRGRMVGLCEAESSKGFTVRTPNARIVDIGTQFGIEVDEQGETLAHVFLGEVEVSPANNPGADAVRVTTNQAASVRLDGVAVLVDAAPQRFVRDVPETEYQAAVLASRPMCYWRGPIEDETRLVLDNGWLGAHGQASESLLNNQSGYAVDDTSGSLGYGADRPAASVTVPYREEFGFDEGFSISAWCWIEPGHQDVMRILSTRVEGGGIGLGVIGRGDKATGGLPASAPILTLFGKSDVVATRAMPEGRWTHLMVTVSRADQVRIYIDGDEVQTRTIPHPRDAGQPGDSDTQPLMIGRNPFTGQGVQAWQGRLDEIAIFDRVLALDEMSTHLNTTKQAP